MLVHYCHGDSDSAMRTLEKSIEHLKTLNSELLGKWNNLVGTTNNNYANNKNYYHQQQQQCNGTLLNRQSMTSIQFNSNYLSTSTQTQSFCIFSFSPLFGKNINLFNDIVPTTSYFDLEPFIEKYAKTKPQKREPLFFVEG